MTTVTLLKPHIKRWQDLWICYTRGRPDFAAYGRTPRLAYARWRMASRYCVPREVATSIQMI